jgi:signal transduction histidine kinase
MYDLSQVFGNLTGMSAASTALFGFLGAIIGSLALWRLSGGRSRPLSLSKTASSLAAFKIDGYSLHPQNNTARRWIGNFDAAADLDRLSAWFPGDAEALAANLVRLEAEGKPFRALADHVNGRAFELIGAPSGGEATLRIAEASDANRALAAARRECAELRRENARLNEVLDTAPILMWRREQDDALSWGNLSYLALSGSDGASAPPRELRGGAEPKPGTDAVGAVRKVSGRQCFFDAHTGERRWYEVRRAPAEDGGEIGYAIDAAPIISAEATLRRFVETLTETFAHLKIGLAIFDRERRLGLFNPAFSELMRLDPAWLAGRPDLSGVLGRLRESQMLPEQHDFPSWRKQLLDLFENPEAADHQDIWRLPGDITIRVLARPHPQGALAFLFEDISETMSLEERFRTEAQMRRATMDRLEEGLAVFGPDGMTQFANPSFNAIWGFQPGADGASARAGEVIAKCAALAEKSADWTRLKEFVTGGDSRSAWAGRFRLLDGRLLRGRFAPLPDGSTLTVFLDVTDTERVAIALRDRNDALVAADEIRMTLVEQIASGLQTPLVTVAERGLALSENRDGFLRPDQQIDADAIVAAAGEIMDALRGGANLASAQIGAVALTDESVDVRDALDSVLSHIRKSVEAHDVRLEVDFHEEVGDVSGDGARVRQILFNLITDAARRCTPGDTVEAGAARRGEMVEIWTREPYPPNAPPPQLEGLAHGLVKRFAEMHQGWVSVTVDAPAAPGDLAGLVVTCALPATVRRDTAVA